jgi:hypothetical protein
MWYIDFPRLALRRREMSHQQPVWRIFPMRGATVTSHKADTAVRKTQ